VTGDTIDRTRRRAGERPGGRAADGARASDAATRPDEELRRLRASVQLLQRENTTLGLLIAIHDRLGALILQGADASAITTALSELVDRPVLLLDQFLRPVTLEPEPSPAADGDGDAATSSWNPNEAYVARVLQTIADDRQSLRLPPLPAWGVKQGCVLAPVVAGDATMGYLAILEPEMGTGESAVLPEAELLAAQHAASVYALALMRERLAAEVRTELRDELLEGLLIGEVADEQAARERARRLGYDEALTYRAIVLVPDDGKREPASFAGERDWAAGWRRRLLDSVAQLVRERAHGAIITRRREELVVLLPEDTTPSPADLGRIVSLYVASLYPDRQLTVGVGGKCRGPKEIATSYAQARRAADVALRFGRRGEIVRFEDLGLYRLLFQISDRAELDAFVEQVLGPLVEYDRKHRSDFLHTIKTYLANNNSLQATAKELFVHVNTAAYRIQRIQTITGLDLGKTEDCLLARVALMVLEDEAAV
jgi:sugar diacid utilization regulator